jgi:hypothetical protein
MLPLKEIISDRELYEARKRPAQSTNGGDEVYRRVAQAQQAADRRDWARWLENHRLGKGLQLFDGDNAIISISYTDYATLQEWAGKP